MMNPRSQWEILSQESRWKIKTSNTDLWPIEGPPPPTHTQTESGGRGEREKDKKKVSHPFYKTVDRGRLKRRLSKVKRVFSWRGALISSLRRNSCFWHHRHLHSYAHTHVLTHIHGHKNKPLGDIPFSYFLLKQLKHTEHSIISNSKLYPAALGKIYQRKRNWKKIWHFKEALLKLDLGIREAKADIISIGSKPSNLLRKFQTNQGYIEITCLKWKKERTKGKEGRGGERRGGKGRRERRGGKKGEERRRGEYISRPGLG